MIDLARLKPKWMIYPGVSARAEIYKQVALFLQEGVRLQEALESLAEIRRERGGKFLNAKGDFLEGMASQFNAQGKFFDALEASGNPPETGLIAAGEEAGKLAETLLFTAMTLEAEKTIQGVIKGAMAYPIVLIAALLGTFWYSAAEIAPVMEHSVKGMIWNGQPAVYFSVGKFIDSPGILLVFAVMAAVALVIRWTLPRWTGTGRATADRFPPWSLYRLLHGVRFMTALSTLIQAGIPMAQAIWKLSEDGNPYLRSRLDSVLFYIRQGKGFGDALNKTGYDFPDAEIVDAMRVYARLADFEKLLKESSGRWLDIALVRTRAQARTMNVLMTVLIGVVLMWIVYVTAVSIPLELNQFVMSHMSGGL
ncbi:type II secretion system F family protein [Acidithiobacillus sp.]